MHVCNIDTNNATSLFYSQRVLRYSRNIQAIFYDLIIDFNIYSKKYMFYLIDFYWTSFLDKQVHKNRILDKEWFKSNITMFSDY